MFVKVTVLALFVISTKCLGSTNFLYALVYVMELILKI